MDNLTEKQRKKCMKAITSKDTKIEVMLRKSLWHKGYRYRKNYKKLLGKPDIVFWRKKIAIFCDGDFWHGYDWENRKNNISTNKNYWLNKIEKNIERDKKNTKKLEEKGWKVLRFWGHEIKNNLDKCVKIIENVYNNREEQN